MNVARNTLVILSNENGMNPSCNWNKPTRWKTTVISWKSLVSIALFFLKTRIAFYLIVSTILIAYILFLFLDTSSSVSSSDDTDGTKIDIEVTLRLLKKEISPFLSSYLLTLFFSFWLIGRRWRYQGQTQGTKPGCSTRIPWTKGTLCQGSGNQD